MGFAQPDGLTGCYWFTSQPQMSILPLSGCVTEKKNHLHWSLWLVSRWLSCSVPQQLETLVGTLPRNVRKAVHGPVGHLSAADNSFQRHVFTELWPPLRGELHESLHVHKCAKAHTHSSTVSASFQIVCFLRLVRKTVQKRAYKVCI